MAVFILLSIVLGVAVTRLGIVLILKIAFAILGRLEILFLNFVLDLPVRLPERAVEVGHGRIAFCLVELQLVDQETAVANERGESAHGRYKKRQLRNVLRRLSRGLVVPKGSAALKKKPRKS